MKITVKKSKIEGRINRIIGQLEAIKRMIVEEEECEKIAVQFKASHSALAGAFRDYLYESAVECKTKDEELLKKVLNILTKSI